MADEPSPDEREDRQRISRAAAVGDARALVHARKYGVLSTISRREEGWPFGSIVPYALDRRGEPVILIASIAEHTKNVRADPRVSLLVHEDPSGDEDVQSRGRLTLLGRAERVREDDLDDARARYLAVVPDAAGYFETHDFDFYRIALTAVRFIGGFGRIFWLDPDEVRTDPAKDPLCEGAAGIVAHMNEDHADALVLYCRAFKNVSPVSARMTAVDQWGFDVRCESPDVRLRFDFDAPVTMSTIRPVVVEMVRRAKEILAQGAG